MFLFYVAMKTLQSKQTSQLHPDHCETLFYLPNLINSYLGS